jgi:hypothetical protein
MVVKKIKKTSKKLKSLHLTAQVFHPEFFIKIND